MSDQNLVHLTPEPKTVVPMAYRNLSKVDVAVAKVIMAVFGDDLGTSTVETRADTLMSIIQESWEAIEEELKSSRESPE